MLVTNVDGHAAGRRWVNLDISGALSYHLLLQKEKRAPKCLGMTLEDMYFNVAKYVSIHGCPLSFEYPFILVFS